jgi:hypothetical protein
MTYAFAIPFCLGGNRPRPVAASQHHRIISCFHDSSTQYKVVQIDYLFEDFFGRIYFHDIPEKNLTEIDLLVSSI